MRGCVPPVDEGVATTDGKKRDVPFLETAHARIHTHVTILRDDDQERWELRRIGTGRTSATSRRATPGLRPTIDPVAHPWSPMLSVPRDMRREALGWQGHKRRIAYLLYIQLPALGPNDSLSASFLVHSLDMIAPITILIKRLHRNRKAKALSRPSRQLPL